MQGSASLRIGVAHAMVLLMSLYLAAIWLASPVSAHPDGGHHGHQGGKTIYVKAGQAIQVAIDGAHPGDQIIVEAGTYAEQLIINKDGISLVGRPGSILVVPETLVTNECTGTAGPGSQAGICIFGDGVVLAPFVQEHQKVLSVARPVAHVSVTGFTIKGFGLDIAVYGAEDTHVFGNWLYDGQAYGILAAGSKGSRITANTIVSEEQLFFIGICNDDMSDVAVTRNHVSGYGIGLCIQTPGAEMKYNDITNCCLGAFIDPGVEGAQLQHNHIGPTNPECGADSPYGAVGVIVDGSINSDVSFNVINGQTAGGMAAGIAVVDDFSTTPAAIASGNRITNNILYNNDFDIYVNTTGTGNVVVGNHCSTPAELCS